MKTSYLLRQCPWMTTDERRVARYTARRAEQAITIGGTALNPAHTCAIFALCTAFAMFQRVQAKLADGLATDGDFVAHGNALAPSQTAFLRAQEHLERITARANGIALPEPAPAAASTPSTHPGATTASGAISAPSTTPDLAALLSITSIPSITSMSSIPVTAPGAKPLHPAAKTFADLNERRRRRNANKAARKRP